MSRPFEPMLAGKLKSEADLAAYLVKHGYAYASPKYDGVRAVVCRGGTLRSRKLLPFANAYTMDCFGHGDFDGLDGEFMLGKPTSKTVFSETSAALRTIEGTPELTFWVFDDFTDPTEAFEKRQERLGRRIETLNANFDGYVHIALVPQTKVKTAEQFNALEAKWTGMGYEGAMLRSPSGPYKFGRSTAIEGYLLKVKRYDDSEAVVIGVEEAMHNANEAQVSELGRTKRTSHKENKHGKGHMGALIVKGLEAPFLGEVFNIGTGYSLHDRAQLWADHTGKPVTFELDGLTYTVQPTGRPVIGRIRKYKYFAVGVKDKPRHPVDLGERLAVD